MPSSPMTSTVRAEADATVLRIVTLPDEVSDRSARERSPAPGAPGCGGGQGDAMTR